MRELREDTFSGNNNKDARDHVDRVLNIVSLFNIPGVSQDTVLLRVFLFTLTETAKRWVDRLTPGAINTWDLLKKAFIQSHQKVNIFYKGLSTMNCKFLDSQGLILGITPTQALMAIQTMAGHSQKWHDETSSRNISSSSNTDGLAAIVSKLDNLGRDMKKLKENVHAVQVRCQICEGPYLDNECPLNEEVKQGAQNEEERTTEVLQCQLPPKELHLGNLTLPCTIGNFNFYGMADLGASVNVMPRNISEYLRLANLRNTNMLVKIADMTKKAPLGHTNVNESVKKALLKSWVIDCFEEALDLDSDPIERSFDDYKWVFDLEIEQLADEYELGIGKKGHILEMIWKTVRKSKVRPNIGGTIIG
nr:hypothetical protein [Tanacetum cinerariifolium]